MTIKWFTFYPEYQPVFDPASIWLADHEDFEVIYSTVELKEKLKSSSTNIVLFTVEAFHETYKLAAEIKAECPSAYLVLVINQQESFDVKNAIRTGINDYIDVTEVNESIATSFLDLKERAILHAKKSLENASKNNVEEQNGKVITLCSPKGGAGKTTVAVNLAMAYEQTGKKVALVDLNLQFGDVPLYMDLSPKKTIYDWVKEKYGTNDDSLIESLVNYKSNISVLAGPKRPEFADAIKGEHIRRLLELLKMKFDIVIVDSASYLDEVLVYALEKSDDIVVIANLDMPSLKSTKYFLDTCRELDKKITIVLNRFRKTRGLTLEIAEKVLNFPIDITISHREKLISASINEGKPLLAWRKSVLTKELKKLVDLLERKIGKEDVQPATTVANAGVKN